VKQGSSVRWTLNRCALVGIQAAYQRMIEATNNVRGAWYIVPLTTAFAPL